MITQHQGALGAFLFTGRFLVTLLCNLLIIRGAQSTENPCVAGSIPAGATPKRKPL
jgi:hypothetical protein